MTEYKHKSGVIPGMANLAKILSQNRMVKPFNMAEVIEKGLLKGIEIEMGTCEKPQTDRENTDENDQENDLQR